MFASVAGPSKAYVAHHARPEQVPSVQLLREGYGCVNFCFEDLLLIYFHLEDSGECKPPANRKKKLDFAMNLFVRRFVVAEVGRCVKCPI